MNILGDLHRRVMTAIGVGSISNPTNETASVQTVQVNMKGSASETLDPIPSMQLFGFASAALAGAQHVVAFLGGDRRKGVAIASNDPRYRPQGMKPGESIVFNAGGVQVYLSNTGLVINGADLPITVNAGSTPVQVNGDVRIGTTRFSTHTHGNGNAGGDTTAPITGS